MFPGVEGSPPNGLLPPIKEESFPHSTLDTLPYNRNRTSYDSNLSHFLWKQEEQNLKQKPCWLISLCCCTGKNSTHYKMPKNEKNSLHKQRNIGITSPSPHETPSLSFVYTLTSQNSDLPDQSGPVRVPPKERSNGWAKARNWIAGIFSLAAGAAAGVYLLSFFGILALSGLYSLLTIATGGFALVGLVFVGIFFSCRWFCKTCC